MNKQTLEQYKDKYIESKKEAEKSEKTIKQYNQILDKFLQNLYIANRDLAKSDVVTYKQQLRELYQVSTVNNKLMVINSFLKFCELDDLTVSFYRVQTKDSLVNVLSVSDYRRLLRNAQKHHDDQIYMVMKTLAETGARIEELKFITVSAIRNDYIDVSNKGKDRRLILTPSLRKELREYCYRNHITGGYVFRQKTDYRKFASKVTLWRDMKRVAGRARVNKDKVHAHSFRHLFALKWIEDGGSVTDLADILGHSRLETTRRYTRTTYEMKKKRLQGMKY